ncbi:MAG TPA: UbiD family decarboxylase [Terriglobales bacterium]|nr:UbiD family decarboxylase [Terriglobales bacterium]
MTGFRTLGDFLADLERRGDLKRVSREVDPDGEVTEIACREAKAEGPALLFERVRGASFPLAVNVLAAVRRIEWALGRRPAAIGAEIEQLAHALPPRRLADLWARRASLGRVLAMRPKRIGRGPAQERALGADLSRLPILRLWPGDGGRFLTFPLVLTESPATGVRNLGVYRMHVYDEKTTGMHWQIGKGGGFHFHEAEKLGRPLPVAVAVGADPALLLASVAPLPEGVDELAFAGFLRGAPTRLARATTIALDVPADAEFVIEGLVPAGERRQEGPFGDHFGHYSHAAPFPVFAVRGITHRRGAVFQASVVGKPPQEDKFMGEAVQAMFTGALRVLHPEIRDLWAYFEAGFHNLLVVAVENRFAKEAMKTALGLMGTGQLSLTKVVVLVDADVNVRDRAAVFGALARNFDPAEDLLVVPGVPLDTLDFTSYTMNLGSKMVLDAQTKPERAAVAIPREPPDPRAFDGRVAASRLAWGGMLVVRMKRGPGADARETRASGSTPGREVVEALVRRPEYAGVKLIVAVSADVPLEDDELLLWGIFTRFDCARDVVPAASESRGAWIACRGPLGIDATWKPGYPEPVASAPEVVAKVDGWWGRAGNA